MNRQFQREPISEGIFYKSLHVDGGKEITIINLKPSFRANPKSFTYEIHGTDKTRICNKVECESNHVNFINFLVNDGETYFIKIEAQYASAFPNQEFFLWYKNNVEIEEEEEEEEDNVEKDNSSDNEEIVEEENGEEDEDKKENYNGVVSFNDLMK